MKLRSAFWYSFKFRVIALTITLFVIGVWSMSFYSGQLLRHDMEELLSKQQVATVSVIAAEINGNLDERIRALEVIAGDIDLPMLDQPAKLQAYLEQRPILQILFNAGAFVTRLDGVAVAEVPRIGRVGLNYLDRDHIATALNENRASVGKAVVGKKVVAPSFAMTTPIRDEQGRVIGALAGATDLSLPNFLDSFVASRYGITGGYLLIDPAHKLFVTTTSNANYEKLVMQPLPSPEINPVLARRLEGFDGSAVNVSSLGIEVLTSSARIPFANWILVASLPTQEAFAPIGATQRQLVLATIFFTIVVGGLLWWFMSRQLRQQFAPMLAATVAIEKYAQTDETPRLLPVNSPGEVGKLLVSFNRLLTALANREERLKESSHRFRSLFERATDGIVVSSAEGQILAANEAFARMHGYSVQELLSMNMNDLDASENFLGLSERMQGQQLVGKSLIAEVEHRHKDGHVLTLEVSSSLIETENRTDIQAFYRDVTERKALERQVAELAYLDAVTRLPNRHLLMDRLKQALAAATRNNQFSALLYIDLDNFKSINDTLGHAAGDQLLRLAAKRLTESVRQIDTVARLGGDEFVVMIEDMGLSPEIAAAESNKVAGKILAGFRQDFEIDGQRCYTTASIGLTLFCGTRGESVESLLKQADLAMYAAKDAGRNTIRFFDAGMQALVQEHVTLEGDLRAALFTGQLLLYYQPQVNASGELISSEALLRWNHPTRGLQLPGGFIPFAERMGLILPIGDWVMETACAQLALWASDPILQRLTLAVNVSAHQFHQAGFVEKTLSAITRHGASPDRLEIEITESVLIQDVQNTITKIGLLREQGIRFALDDFGTGYSSLSYLRRLPLDQLKIDQSFVEAVPEDANACVVARTIILLGNSLGFRVIAEGVETPEQREFLAANDCLFYQGYLFGRPMPSDEFKTFVHANSRL